MLKYNYLMDQNNMGGNGMGNGMAMPNMATAPNMAPMPGAAPTNMQQPTAPIPGTPAAMALNAQQQKKSSTLAETLILIVVCLIAATAIVFAVYFFMQFNELKTDFDLQKDAAVAEAVAKQQDEDNAKFAEAEKLPYKQFSGPSDYGSISFEYPKTWNVYIDSDGLSNNSDFISYFRPEQVDSIKDNTSRFALRFKILNQQITNVQKQYDSKIQSGKMTSSIFNADNNNITGTKYVGEIEKDMNGIVVLIKVNDKTAIFQTDSMVYQQDFETLISKIRRNS